MPPFFSIIIPSFNRADYIRVAIDTVLAQTFNDFEIILVDDGSTDNTEEVVSNIKDHRIKYFKKYNEERSIARNYGVQKSVGQYVNFLDSDDRFYPNHLKTAYELILSKEYPEVCHLGFEKISLDGKILFQRNHFDPDLAANMIIENVMHCNAIFIKRLIATQIQFINSKDAIISEDWYVWLRLTSRYKIHTINTITSAVVEHSHRSLNNIDTQKLMCSTELVIRALKEDKAFQNYYKGKVNRFYANQYTYVMLILAMRNDRKRYFYFLARAIGERIGVILERRFIASLKIIVTSLFKSKK